MTLPRRPPAAGGTQVSIRLPGEVLDRLDDWCGTSGWNRGQTILYLLMENLGRLEDEAKVTRRAG